MKNLPNLASMWTTPDSKVFKIEQLNYDTRGLWVYYKNTQTGQTYNCLLEAFLQRFKEQLA